MTDSTLSFVSSSWDEANVTNIMYTIGLQVEIILLLAKVSLYMRNYAVGGGTESSVQWSMWSLGNVSRMSLDLPLCVLIYLGS